MSLQDFQPATDEQIAELLDRAERGVLAERYDMLALIARVRQAERRAERAEGATDALLDREDRLAAEAARLREQVERVRATASANATVARESGNSEAERHSRDILVITAATEEGER